MEYNWIKIREKVFSYCRNAFQESNMSITEDEIKDAIVVFYNFVNYSVPYPEIGGLGKEMIKALQGSCVDDIGNVSQLKSLASLEDPFMKKLIVLCGIDSFSNVSGLSQMRLLKIIGLWGSVIPDFDHTDIESYKGLVNGAYILGMTVLTRNKVHLSPDWDDSEVTRRLKYVISFYILLVYRNMTRLTTTEPRLAKQELHFFEENPENALLYDYISYGNSSVEIKKRYVRTYIEHQLYRLGEMEEKGLLLKMQEFSEMSLKEEAAKRILQELVKEGLIKIVKHSPKAFTLAEEEYARIHNAEESYNLALQSYNASMSEILTRYGITASVDTVSELIMNLLSAQYNYDIEEAIGDSSKAEKVDYKSLIKSLIREGCQEAKANDLYKELLVLNRDNDILVRISAGRAFRRISNPDQFNEYFRKADRAVWVDTQILLYLLCYNEDYSQYDNPLYKTALALFKYSKTNSYFHFKVANFYINELIYQLRQALLLISIVDMPFAQNTNLSRNVFYQHYRQLRENDGLPDNVESFADYMEDNFNLYADDAFALDFSSIARGVVESKFEEFNIKIETVPLQDQNDISNSEGIFISVSSIDGASPKQGKTLNNDAWMGVSLFKHSEEQKPIFISLDSSFEPYRKLYMQKYRRGLAFNWHLFSPSAFVNHMDFIDFKVNADNLTDDLISIVETDEVKDKTISVIDRINRFLDIPHISSGKRKKYIAWVGDLFQTQEFSYKQEACSNESVPSRLIRFLDAQDAVFTYFHDQGDAVKSFQDMLIVEDRFKKYLEFLKEYASNQEETKDDLIFKVELEIENFTSTESIVSEKTSAE